MLPGASAPVAALVDYQGEQGESSRRRIVIGTINAVLDVRWGGLINLSILFNAVWNGLFRGHERPEVSPGSAWIVLALICATCVWLLYRKLRAVEVVR